MESFQTLEHELAEWIGTTPNHVVVCSSGTAALHLAFEAINCAREDTENYVLMSDFNMIACPRAATLSGLGSAFIDCKNDLTIDTNALYEFASDPMNNVYGQCLGVLATHIYGRVCDMKEVAQFCLDYGAYVIEDLAEAHGVMPHPGTDAAIWSFYKNKIIAGEEGGAVYFRDPRHANLSRQLRSLGFTDAHDFMHIPRGHNYRLANCLADKIRMRLGIYQTKGIISPDGQLYGSVLDMRRAIESAYEALCPVEWRMPERQAPWVYDLRIPRLTYEKQGEIVKALNSGGIAARHAFKPMSSQPEYKNMRRVGGDNAERASREVLYLPLSPHRNCMGDVTRAFDIIHQRLEVK